MVETKRVFDNHFRKVRNKDEYMIYSGPLKVCTIHYGEGVQYDYLKFEDGFQISTAELKEVLQICERETPYVRARFRKGLGWLGVGRRNAPGTAKTIEIKFKTESGKKINFKAVKPKDGVKIVNKQRSDNK